MAKSAGQKRRRKDQQRARARTVREARRAPRSGFETWSAGKVTVWTIVVVAAFVGLVPAFWYWVAPAVSDLVGPIPVLSTIVGWLQAGGAMAAVGFFMVNYHDLLPKTRERISWALGAWGVVALATVPIEMDSPALHVDYYAGLRAGFTGLLLSFVVVPLAVAVLWKPFHRGREASTAVWGYALIGYSVLVLLLGATYFRIA